MITLCALAAPVSIRPPQSPQLRAFRFFMSQARQPGGSERLCLHMGYFDTLAEAEKRAESVRRHYPCAFATLAPGELSRPANPKAPSLPHDASYAVAPHSRDPAPVKEGSLTDTQVLKILEARRVPTIYDDVEDTNLDQIELLPLGRGGDGASARQPGNRVLMILVTRDRMVRNRVLYLDEPVSPEELISVRNYVNRNFSGWQLGAARRELLRRMEEERAMYDAVERKLQLLCNNGLLAVDTAPDVHMEGASNLLGLDLHLTREKLRDLLRALEEKKRLIELLDRFLELPAGELEVHVGLEQAHPTMKDLSLIGMTVRLAGGMPAKVAVLGPMRMQYERVMAAVLQTSLALGSASF